MFKFAASSVATVVLSGNMMAQQPVQTQPVPQRSNAQVQSTVQNQQETRQLPGNAIRGNISTQQAGAATSQQASAAQAQHNGQASGQHQTTDQYIAHCLTLANREEVELAQFAKSKAKDKGVQEFASMMEEDHSKMLEKLSSISKRDTNQQGNAGSVSAEQAKRGELTGGTGASADGAGAVSANNTVAARGIDPNAGMTTGSASSAHLQIQDEVAQQCLEDSKKLLSEKEGSELDKCYVGHQLVKHAGMVSKLTVFERHANGELKNLISQGLDTTKKHMKHAEGLMENLAKSDSSSSNRKSDSE